MGILMLKWFRVASYMDVVGLSHCMTMSYRIYLGSLSMLTYCLISIAIKPRDHGDDGKNKKCGKITG